MSEIKPQLKSTITNLPDKPGVYIYRDAERHVIYVGKAINLKNRVRSYFQSPEKLGPKTAALVSNIEHLETLEVESEIEALLLEAELIKRYKPRYNIILKDDKSYLYIKISTNEEIPRISTARRENVPGATYFGPFPSALTAKSVLKTIRRIFPYRSCKTLPKTPCLFFHIGLCKAPCAGYIDPESYRKEIKQIMLFLEGKRKELERQIEREMQQAAEELAFEEAAKLKKQLDDIHYITQSFRKPEEYIENPNLKEDQRTAVLEELQEHLKKYILLPNLPIRIETYDISNIQGKQAVGAMVVATNAEPDKREYRKFKIKTKDTPDDFTMMSEMLRRRFNNDWPMPDLVVIDGGKGQLQVAIDTITQAGLAVPTISLAKRLEEIWVKTENGFEAILLPRRSKALQLLQQMRDEAHRFGITFHRSLRSKKLLNDK
jgi:excinuclease ABC subunit C